MESEETTGAEQAHFLDVDADDASETATQGIAPAKPAKIAKSADKTKPAVGMPKRIKIWLEESDDIPPTGLPLGHNGISYIIKPGEPVEIPEFLVEILDHAVMASAVLDPQTKQVVGWRDRLRYPYRRLSA